MKLTILMYHAVRELPDGVVHRGNYVRPDQFEAQLAALRDWGYESVTLDGWLEYRRGHRAIPRRAVALTFDDGDRSVYDVAWPLMRRYGFTGTTFVVSGLIGRTNEWDASDVQHPLLSSHEILELRREGMMFGSHTRSHVALTRLPRDEALAELEGSRRDLEALLGEPVRALAYPYSKQNREVRELAREAGYEVAVRGRGHMNRRATDPLALRRIKIDADVSLGALRWVLFRERWLRV